MKYSIFGLKTALSCILVILLANCASQQHDTVVDTTPVAETEEQKVVITGSRISGNVQRAHPSSPQIVSERVTEITNQLTRIHEYRVATSSDSQTIGELLNNTANLSAEEKRSIYKLIDNDPGLSGQIFQRYRVNPTIFTENNPVSTFSMDVDNGAYKLAANMLALGQLPNPDGIRVEEFVNALDYQYQPSDELFAISAEAMPSPLRNGYHILHLGVQTKTLSDSERAPSNLVLVVDVSGSMGSDDKLDLLKQAMTTLVSQLDRRDKIAIIAYNDYSKRVLNPTSASDKQTIYNAINNLRSGGSTNAEQGLIDGYQLAQEMFIGGYNNRVILTSDGMANVGSSSPDAIIKQITQSKEQGIFLTTLGVGVGMYNDYLLEQLANKGNGNYLYLANQRDIQDAFVDQLTSQLQTVAKDAKIQVSFNNNVVTSYRLLGYENRHLETQDFTDPDKDGGEVGAGHRVTALYEVKLNHSDASDKALPIGKIAIAYKKPQGHKVHYLHKEIPQKIIQKSLRQSSADSRLSYAAAAFAEKLRQSYWARLYRYEDIQQLLQSLPVSFQRQEQVKKLVTLVNIAKQLDSRLDRYEDDAPLSTIDFDRVPLLD